MYIFLKISKSIKTFGLSVRVKVQDTINSYKKLYCKQMISSARALRNKSYVIQRAAPCMIGPIMHGAAFEWFWLLKYFFLISKSIKTFGLSIWVKVEDTINSYNKLYCKQIISSARALRNKSYVIQRAAPCMIGTIMHGAALCIT